MVAARRRQERQSIHRSVARDRDDESDRCIQCALGEGDIERDDLFANLEDRDKETGILGGSLQMLVTAAEFLLGPNMGASCARTLAVMAVVFISHRLSGRPANRRRTRPAG